MRQNISKLIHTLQLDVKMILNDSLCQRYLSEIIAIEYKSQLGSTIDWQYVFQSAVQVNQFYQRSINLMQESADREVLSNKIKIFILHHLIIKSRAKNYKYSKNLRDGSPFYHYAMH